MVQARHDLALSDHERRLVLLADVALIHHLDGKVRFVLLEFCMENLQGT